MKGRIALAAGGLTTVVDIYADRDPAGGAGAIHFARRDPASTRERLMHSDTIETEQTSALLRVYFYSRLPKCLEKKDISAKREGEEETKKHGCRLDWSTAQLFPLPSARPERIKRSSCFLPPCCCLCFCCWLTRDRSISFERIQKSAWMCGNKRRPR